MEPLGFDTKSLCFRLHRRLHSVWLPGQYAYKNSLCIQAMRLLGAHMHANENEVADRFCSVSTHRA